MRALLAFMLLAMLAGSAAAGQDKVVRVSGELTYETYPPLATLLMDSFDAVVGLKLSLAENDYDRGSLAAYKEDDLLLVYMAGAGGDSQISAREGFTLAGGVFTFDGFYKVVYAGMGQGITAIFLEPATPPAGLPVEDVSIGSLPAPPAN